MTYQIQRTTLEADYVRTMDWFENHPVDWNSAGTQYLESGEKKQLHTYHHGFICDGSITSENGEYVLIYQKLGTKGLLLKNGVLLREINRSYYQSSVYEFPAAFLTYQGDTYLIHCPSQYCRIDIEHVETGEIITNHSERDPQDFFHSRFEVSKDQKHLISKGWFWHPFDMIELFNIEACIADPRRLDSGKQLPKATTELSSASFIDNQKILVCSSNEEPMDDENIEPIPPGHLGIWNIDTDEVEKSVKPHSFVGNVFAIDENMCWDLFKHPKIIDLNTGEILAELTGLDSGAQGSSIIHHLDDLPKVAFNSKTKKIVIGRDAKIDILTPTKL